MKVCVGRAARELGVSRETLERRKPLGVIDAQHDTEAFSVLDSVREHAKNDPDIHLFSDSKQVSQTEVAAVQTGADVFLQKSLREGFGLSAAEALWKGTPVIGGNCGGIRLQIDHGEGASWRSLGVLLKSCG